MIGFLDLPSGLSGDMFLGCLLDAGWPFERLRSLPGRLLPGPAGCTIEARPVLKGPLRAVLVTVVTAAEHTHRGLAEVRAILASADLPGAVRERATAVFVRLAEAEAKVHGTTPDRIHFHEVGAIDALVDIAGAVWGLDELGVERLWAAPVPLGGGWTDSAHGRLPLPAPATLELLAAVGAPTLPAPAPGEWLTPTAAALLAELARFEQPPMRLARIGCGAGQCDAPWPNVARLWLGEPEPQAGPLVEIQTNIDDMNPQLYAPVSERLFGTGALDVWLAPVQMKKGRPAVVLSVLAPAALEGTLAELILRETTSLGVRVHAVHRHEAQRQSRQVHTPFGAVSIKLKSLGGEMLGASPEYEQCRALAGQAGVPVRLVYEAALAAAWRAEESAPGGPAPQPAPHGAST